MFHFYFIEFFSDTISILKATGFLKIVIYLIIIKDIKDIIIYFNYLFYLIIINLNIQIPLGSVIFPHSLLIISTLV